VVVSNPYTNATSQPATLTVLPAGPTSVGQFSSDFESGLPLGTSLFGSASVAAGSGADGNRVLKLMASGQGSFGDLVIDEFSGGAPVTAFFASFDLLLGGGADRPADGFSFNFTTNLPAPPAYGNPSEEGLTNGLSLCFDTFDNFLVDHGPVTGTDDTAPAIDVKVNGRPLAFQSMAGLRVERTPGGSAPAGPLLIDPQTGQPLALETEPPAADGPTMTHFAPVTIELKVDGTLWVTYKGVLVLSNVQTHLPPLSGAKFAFGGRTGSLFENVWIDNLAIQTYSAPRPLVFATDGPTNQWVFEGQRATFRADLFGSEPIFIQWFSNNVSILGATNSAHRTPPATLANSGDIYRIEASNALNAISRSAMLGIQPVVFLTAGPTNQAVRTNQTATFGADLYGSPPIRIQWFSNNVPILNATNSTQTAPPATAANDGDVYRVEASNSFSSTNRSATLTVLLQPVIVQPPQSQTNI
ncbi:MAG TPA: hypothetical protein VNM37_28300, partial [Candidatus Dormibacteraeota bacterium]|nr:hypothetical protein [Candidatus Dormibacteraeota bacterium]